MSEVLERAQVSSWALCPGSISPLTSGIRDFGAMDPRDKPWDDSVGAASSHSNRWLRWIPASAAMTVVGWEVAR